MKAQIDMTTCSRDVFLSLPEGTCVAGTLTSRTRVDYVDLPPGLRVFKLDLYNCQEHVVISPGTRVADAMLLDKCAVTELPNDLIVGWFLDVSNCVWLRDLPRDLIVGTNIGGASVIRFNSFTRFSQDPEKLQELELVFKGKLWNQ